MRYQCATPRRKALVSHREGIDGNLLNGLDYLEVSLNQKILAVHFVHTLPGQEGGIPPNLKPLGCDNFVIEGGTRTRDINIESINCRGNLATIRLSSPGDFSIYRLRLVKSPSVHTVPDGFDPQLSYLDFSFKVWCPNEFDPMAEKSKLREEFEEPNLDYMAKDYASFRRMMLDRLAVTLPAWKERSPADLGITLVELLAYVGDYLSYYQDAVATEAYLETARKRSSIRRHARLLDYKVDEGCNSRVWVCFEVKSGPPILLQKCDEFRQEHTKITTYCDDKPVISACRLQELFSSHKPEIFELMHDTTLYSQHNKISFYTWSDRMCCLPIGSTSATLSDDPDNRLLLRAGDILILEELKDVETGLEADANPAKRHAVRLKHVIPEAKFDHQNPHLRQPGELKLDPLTGHGIAEVEWHLEDALPFALCVSTTIKGKIFNDISCARANVVLADHGRTLLSDAKGSTIQPGTSSNLNVFSDMAALIPSIVPSSRAYKPTIKHKDITFCTSYDHAKALDEPASFATSQKSFQALPAIKLESDDDSRATKWDQRYDLLNSDCFSPDFMMEMEEDRTGRLRFGDGVQGRKPSPGSSFNIRYRVGSGTRGNIGADSLAHIVPPSNSPFDPKLIIKVRNPIPATGGTNAEPSSQVKLHAPPRFRKQMRAVTEKDYEEIIKRHPEVINAIASWRWTGSWYTVFITVDRRGGHTIDTSFEKELRDFLEPFRMAGHDVRIENTTLSPWTSFWE